MAIFAKKSKFLPAPNQLTRTVELLQQTVNNSSTITSPQITRAALAMEGLSDSQAHALTTATNELSTALEAIAAELNISKAITPAQVEAATAAGVLVGDIKSFLNTEITRATVSTESMAVVNMASEDSFNARSLALEAYDERDNRNAAVYSIAYNMQAARQDEFGETFFPTIVVTPDQVGFGVTVRLMSVMNDFNRQITGELDKYERKNLIRALADPTILKNEMTRIIPVYRPQAADKFVDTALIPSRTVLLEGEPIETAPLATGKKLSLLGISQTDTLLNNGLMDVTDSIDTGTVLQTIYLKVGNDILQYNVANLPLSNFIYSVQNNYRVMTLNFDTTSVLLNKNTKQTDGSALVDLAPVVTQDLIVRIALNISGTINIETADTVVYGNNASVFSVQNAAGELLDLASSPASDVVTLFANATVVGYELKAYRTNLNRRQRGQLINTTYYTQLYNVNLRSPITAIHPVTTDGQTDTSDLAALITATRIRTSNAAVGTLLDTAQILNEYVDARDYEGVGPDVLGAGRFFVKPTFFSESINVDASIDSLKSHERAADIQAVLVNKIRDYAYRMYRDSEYKAAADALAGGVAPVPTVIIGTDPVLARYLTVTGDLRTLGNEFDVRIVSTLDNRVAGKIFVTFGIFDENRNTQVNALNFGNMAYSPEVTIVLPISRNGQVSRELAVQPRFLHINNLPIMTVLSIEGITDVLNKVPVNFHSV
jgi:hypothetical protein